MKILYKKVGRDPEVMDIEPTLEEYQKLVDGLIEVYYLWNEKDSRLDNYLAIVNEEGKLLNMDMNIGLSRDVIVGDFFIVKDSGDDFTDIDEDDIPYLVAWINSSRRDLF